MSPARSCGQGKVLYVSAQALEPATVRVEPSEKYMSGQPLLDWKHTPGSVCVHSDSR